MILRLISCKCMSVRQKQLSAGGWVLVLYCIANFRIPHCLKFCLKLVKNHARTRKLASKPPESTLSLYHQGNCRRNRVCWKSNKSCKILMKVIFKGCWHMLRHLYRNLIHAYSAIDGNMCTRVLFSIWCFLYLRTHIGKIDLHMLLK